MDAQRFSFSVSVPRDERFASTVRALAGQAARYAGSVETAGTAFADAVEQALREQVVAGTSAAGEAVAIVMRRDGGPVEVLVDGRLLTLEP